MFKTVEAVKLVRFSCFRGDVMRRKLVFPGTTIVSNQWLQQSCYMIDMLWLESSPSQTRGHPESKSSRKSFKRATRVGLESSPRDSSRQVWCFAKASRSTLYNIIGYALVLPGNRVTTIMYRILLV